MGSTLQAHQPLKIANSNLFISFVRADLQAMFFPPMISKHAHISLVNLFVMMMMVGILFSGCSKVHWTLKIETSLQIRKGSCSHFSSFWNEWSFSILSLKCEKLTIKIEHFYWRDFFAHILRFVPSCVHYLYFHFGGTSMTKEKLMLI